MEPPLRTGRLILRVPRADDVGDLAAILAEPAVAAWWPDYDDARIRDEFVSPQDDVTVLVIEHDERVIGIVQFGEESDPQYRHASIDLFIDPRVHGRGLGPEAITAVVDHLVDERGHHRIVIDPAATNARAIRAYEKVGFRKVGTLREYERGPDGAWRDGLLMELLAHEHRDRRLP